VTSMRVSVIIPSHNCAAYVPAAIESVLGQTYPPHEIIVVDDGSTDGTLDRLAPYRDRITLRSAPASGPAGARNGGLAAAAGDLVAFLDADDLWEPTKLGAQVEFFEAEAALGACFTDYTTFGSDLEPPSGFAHAPRFPSVPRSALGHGRYALTSSTLVADFLPPCPIPCRISTVAVRRECLARTGMFDGTLTVAEDLQMFSRLAHTCSFGFIDRSLVRRRVHRASISHALPPAERLRRELQSVQSISRFIPLTRPQQAAVRRKTVDVRLSLARAELERGGGAAARRESALAFAALPSRRTAMVLAAAWLPGPMRLAARRLRNRQAT
jgi:glycosyltransferase involved in cell wall biosynthesis